MLYEINKVRQLEDVEVKRFNIQCGICHAPASVCNQLKTSRMPGLGFYYYCEKCWTTIKDKKEDDDQQLPESICNDGTIAVD